jgi:GTPase
VRPRAIDESGFTVEQDDEGVYVVRGAKVERWIRQTNFDNDEVVGYLADRLERLGVEDTLAKKGAKPGDPVRIGEREFDWQPNAGEFVSGPRGTDARLEDDDARATAAERLAARKARRVRSDDELLHMAADGTVTSVANAHRPVLVTDEDDTDE